MDGHISLNLEDQRLPEFTPRPFTGATRTFSQEERELIERSYGLTYRELNYFRLSIDTVSGRLVIPIEGPASQFRGYVLSNLPGSTEKPKSLIYKVLDEPFAGVDPIAVEDIQAIVKKLKEKNIGILITDHNVNETLSICDRAYLLIEGKIFKHGTAEELAADDQVRRLYLGLGQSGSPLDTSGFSERRNRAIAFE